MSYLPKLFLLLFSWGIVAVVSSQVGISESGLVPDPNAILDMSSTTKGFLPPRMTTAQRDQIPNPANGLQVFNTDCNTINFNAGTSAAPEWVSVTSGNSPVAGVQVFANPAGAVCEGTPVTYTASLTNGGTSPTYQWKRNGENIDGATGSSYTSALPVNGDLITCVITSNAPCVTGSPAYSNEIQEIVNPILPAGITIAADPVGEVCEGTSVTFTASPVNGGSAPSYQWFSNGDIIPGAVSSVFSSSSLDNGEVITCSMASSLNCVSGSPALSNSVTLQVVPTVTAYVSISVSPEGSVCQGSVITFTATPVNGGTSPTYQWKKNGEDIDGATGATYSSSALEHGDAISCVMTSNESCVLGSPASSNFIAADIIGGSGGTQTFNYTGAAQSFVVPACISSVNIQVWGAQGGTSFYNGNPLAGALGGYATGDLAVTPGQSLGVYVGRQGAPNNNPSAGWNGGACGGNGNNGYGGGGGDGTDVRVGGTGFSNRVIVAGGGGGAWTNPSYPVGSGGVGGGTNGDGWPASQAQGGTQTQGGQISPWTEFSGGFGYGGTYDGTPWPNGCGNGGGGGGGWYGGSSASGCCAGPGGGGSGYIGGVSNGSMQSGVRSGHGQVIISW